MTKPKDEMASIPVAHAAELWDRARLARHHAPAGRPDCVVLGHAWRTDSERQGWLICLECEVVRED